MTDTAIADAITSSAHWIAAGLVLNAVMPLLLALGRVIHRRLEGQILAYGIRAMSPRTHPAGFQGKPAAQAPRFTELLRESRHA